MDSKTYDLILHEIDNFLFSLESLTIISAGLINSHTVVWLLV